MECYVHPTIPYMDQPAMFQKQREFLLERIADVSTSTKVHKGLSASDFENGTLSSTTSISQVLREGGGGGAACIVASKQ